MEPIVSFSTAIFDGYNLDVALEELAKVGVTHVEPAFIKGYMGDFTEDDFSDARARDLRRKLDAAGLSCFAMSSHMDLGKHDIVDVFKGRMTFAKGIGAQLIISNTSNRGAATPFLSNIEILARRAAELDLIIGLENPGHGSDDLIGCGSAAVSLLRSIDSEAVRVNYDVGNIHTYNHGRVDIRSDLQGVLPFAAHLHLKDVTDDGTGWAFCGIGKGLIDWRSILTLVRTMAPTLPLALEIPLRLQRPNYADPRRRSEVVPLDAIRHEIRGSLDYVRALLAEDGTDETLR